MFLGVVQQRALLSCTHWHSGNTFKDKKDKRDMRENMTRKHPVSWMVIS